MLHATHILAPIPIHSHNYAKTNVHTCTSNNELCLCCFQRRGELENHSVDAASTSETVGFITLMQELKRQVRSWEQKVEVRSSML